jgi:hypothetical protein
MQKAFPHDMFRNIDALAQTTISGYTHLGTMSCLLLCPCFGRDHVGFYCQGLLGLCPCIEQLWNLPPHLLVWCIRFCAAQLFKWRHGHNGFLGDLVGRICLTLHTVGADVSMLHWPFLLCVWDLSSSLDGR